MVRRFLDMIVQTKDGYSDGAPRVWLRFDGVRKNYVYQVTLSLQKDAHSITPALLHRKHLLL